MTTSSLIGKLRAASTDAGGFNSGVQVVSLEVATMLIRQHQAPAVDEHNIRAIIISMFEDGFEDDFKSDFAHCLMQKLRPYLTTQQSQPDVVEALKFYADTSKYVSPFTGGMGELYFDCGQKAKAAIAAMNMGDASTRKDEGSKEQAERQLGPGGPSDLNSPASPSEISGIDPEAWDALRKSLPNDKDFVFRVAGAIGMYERAKKPVSLEDCANAAHKRIENNDMYCGYPPSPREIAKAVLDAAGVKYVD